MTKSLLLLTWPLSAARADAPVHGLGHHHPRDPGVDHQTSHKCDVLARHNLQAKVTRAAGDDSPLLLLQPLVAGLAGSPSGCTAKKFIGNRLSRLKSASLLMQNTISSTGIFLTTHSVLLYIIDSKKCFSTMLMGENPRYLMENTIPRLCWEMPTIYRKLLMPG